MTSTRVRDMFHHPLQTAFVFLSSNQLFFAFFDPDCMFFWGDLTIKSAELKSLLKGRGLRCTGRV